MGAEPSIRAAAAKALAEVLEQVRRHGPVQEENPEELEPYRSEIVFVPNILRWSMVAFPGPRAMNKPCEWTVGLMGIGHVLHGECSASGLDSSDHEALLDRVASLIAADVRANLRDVYEGLNKAGVTGEMFAQIALDAIASAVHEE